MTPAEKRKFMRDLTRNVLNQALADVKHMPEEWDGHELRRLLADRFEDATIMLTRCPKKRLDASYRKRLRAFDNECLTRNL